MPVYSFHGGIHPPENKVQSTRLPVDDAPIPKHLVVPVLQHLGMAADPVVDVGERVLKGQLIAEPVGRISVAVHAPSSGRVIGISQQPVPHASGLEAECILIETDGQDSWCEHQGLEDYTKLSPNELIDFIRHKGIAGMGGAGFPTDVKLHLGDDHIVNTLIINAAECEPYITADDTLMRIASEEIVGGIEIIAHLLKPHHIIIGIEDNKPDAIAALNIACRESNLAIDIQIVPTKYPSGGERQLIQLLTNVEVPSGKIPADVGIVCQNVGTLAAIYDAISTGRPLLSRIVTVTGDALAQPRNLRTLIGTPFSTLLDYAGIDRSKMSRLVMGGPMMGIPVTSEQIPVIKTTNCIIAATAEEMPPTAPAQACIRCGLCEQACPAQLLPQQLYWFAKGKEFDKARDHDLFDCIECGACAYVCPSNIPLVQYYRFAKSEIRNEELEQRRADHARARFEARKQRLEREAEQKEARRKQRALEAAAAQAERRKALEMAQAKAASDTSSAQAPSESLTRALATQSLNSDLESNTTSNTTPNAVPDIKALKVAAALARTKLSKAQKALKNAQDKGLEGSEALAATVAILSEKSEAAQINYDKAQALEAAEQSKAPSETVQTAAETVANNNHDIKALKQQVSIMRTKLKKAKASGEDEAEISRLVERLDQAQQQVWAVEAEKTAQATAQGIDLKQLKIDAALAKAAVTKLDRAINASESEDERSKLSVELAQKQETALQLSQQLARFE